MTSRSLDSERCGRSPSALDELRALRQVRHPSIVMFFGAVVQPRLREVALVLERVVGPTLEAYIKGRGRAATAGLRRSSNATLFSSACCAPFSTCTASGRRSCMAI